MLLQELENKLKLCGRMSYDEIISFALTLKTENGGQYRPDTITRKLRLSKMIKAIKNEKGQNVSYMYIHNGFTEKQLSYILYRITNAMTYSKLLQEWFEKKYHKDYGIDAREKLLEDLKKITESKFQKILNEIHDSESSYSYDKVLKELETLNEAPKLL